MTWSDELSDALEDIRDELGESSSWSRYSSGTPSGLAGTQSRTLIDGPDTLTLIRTRETESLQSGGGGGRVAIESLQVWVLAADLSWTPTPLDTEVTIAGTTYRPAAVEAESDGKVWRCRLERLASE